MQIDIKWCWNNLTDRFYCFFFFFSLSFFLLFLDFFPFFITIIFVVVLVLLLLLFHLGSIFRNDRTSRRPLPLNPYYTTIPSMQTLPIGMPSLPNISNMPMSAYAMQPNTWGTLHWA